MTGGRRRQTSAPCGKQLVCEGLPLWVRIANDRPVGCGSLRMHRKRPADNRATRMADRLGPLSSCHDQAQPW
ncbi:hypothetical protein HMPREF0972_00942 [Actinomyces sp. oral taxon 848 str. F0332]|nr:hypothetical protein HMPREF0972_00942 [Actinomyces sp. oral taxon 848 str. F0332]